MTNDTRDDWDAFWQQGFSTSFADYFTDNYTGAIRDFWVNRFSGLPSGSVVADIGAGNGALAMIANRVAKTVHGGLEIHAIDQADIRPPANPGHSEWLDATGVTFHPRTPSEATGFPAASLDFACGQFALEYSRLPESVRELARIIKAGGRLAFILHHPDSVIVRGSRDEVGLLRNLLRDKGGLLKIASRLAYAIGNPATQEDLLALRKDPVAERFREQLNAAVTELSGQKLASQAQQALTDVLDILKKVFGGSAMLLPAAEKDQHIKQLSRDLGHNLQRLHQMVSVAQDPQQMQALSAVLHEAGFEAVTVGPFQEADGRLLGWSLEARRRT